MTRARIFHTLAHAMALRLHVPKLAGVRLALAILAAVAGIGGACTTMPGSSGCAREQCDSSGNCINPQPALPLCTDNGEGGKTSTGGSNGSPEGGTNWGISGGHSVSGNHTGGFATGGGLPGLGGSSTAGGHDGHGGGLPASGGSPAGGEGGDSHAGESSGGANQGAGGEGGQGADAGNGGDAPSPLVITH